MLAPLYHCRSHGLSSAYNTTYKRETNAQGKAELTDVQQALADAVRNHLKAAAVGAPSTIGDDLKAAARLVPSSSERSHGRVMDVWNILELQVRHLRTGGSAAGVQRGLLRGSVEHLEAAYYTHVQQRVHEERLAAASGGSGSVGSVIAGFVNAGLPGAGPEVRAWLEVCHTVLQCFLVKPAPVNPAPWLNRPRTLCTSVISRMKSAGYSGFLVQSAQP
jgi:hypothetical protein